MAAGTFWVLGRQSCPAVQSAKASNVWMPRTTEQGSCMPVGSVAMHELVTLCKAMFMRVGGRVLFAKVMLKKAFALYAQQLSKQVPSYDVHLRRVVGHMGRLGLQTVLWQFA